ncbi:MAG TPA: phosphotransferase family protein [Ktedonobacteraceae bacterium]|nr:phosphotransferase family protein [Ktedonobacteraceae bacterium]
MSTPEDTIEVRAEEQLNWPKIEQYLRTHVPDIGAGTLQARQFPSGASNLTYQIRIGNWEGVLRRPPLGPVPPKAHDMRRESGLLERISPVFPLAPRPYVFCNDPEVMDAPFYVMERLQGVVVNSEFPPDVSVTPEFCRRLSETIVDTLVEIHAVPWQKAGLTEFGHPEGFMERQVKGWIERFMRSQTDESPDTTFVTRWLLEHIPQSPAPTLIHNDFKLNNILLNSEDLVHPTGVLDWEMATIGDPLFDLGVSLGYWVEQNDSEELRTILPAITQFPGFFTRAEFMERYASKSRRDLSSMQFYLIFAYFKLSGIIQQIYVRWKRGQTQDERFASYGSRIHALVDYATYLATSKTL